MLCAQQRIADRFGEVHIPEPVRMSEAKERNLERDLALRLIRIGYSVLSKELHPDKGGSRNAQQRLNKVVKSLRECVERW